MAPKLLSLIGAAAVLVCMGRLSQAAPATFDYPNSDQSVYFPDYSDRVEKREWPFRRLLPLNPILIYHQSIRQPRYLAQAVASANNEPNSDIPRRLIRRGNGTVYSPSRVIAWNHQLLPTFYKFNQFRSNADGRTTNNKRNNDWTSRLAARSVPFSFPASDNGLDDASQGREPGNPLEYDEIEDGGAPEREVM